MTQSNEAMILVTTTETVEGYEIVEYKGVIHSQVVLGVNVLKDFFGAIRGFVGGRMEAIEDEMRQGFAISDDELRKQAVLRGANAVIAAEYDGAIEGDRDKVLVISASATAVVLRRRR